jgi:hypothetical protein
MISSADIELLPFTSILLIEKYVEFKKKYAAKRQQNNKKSHNPNTGAALLFLLFMYLSLVWCILYSTNYSPDF